MKKLFLFGLGALLLLIAVALFVVFRDGGEIPPEEFPAAEFPTTEIPAGTNAGNTKMLTVVGSQSIFTADFIQNGAAVPDVANPGHFFVGNAIDPTREDAPVPPYVIEYVESTHYFSIALLSEPIGEVRLEAERYLQQTLNISQSDMCQLKYMVSVPNRINPSYAGYNLRFSFCPGAIPLAS